MGRLDGKVCVVTGGAKGLGAAFAKALATEGARVAIADISDGQALALEIGGLFVETDVSDPDQVLAFATAIRSEFGPPDVLVNNAAVYATLPMQSYRDIPTDLWDRVMAVNLRGAFNMVQCMAPMMEARGSGKIINVTSGTVYKGLPNMLHYITSKGGLTAMTRALSRELGRSGICVNSLAPGLTLSDSVQENSEHLDQTREKVVASRAIRRDGMPEDLIGALIFLASDDSNFVTGQTLVVDGGSVNT
ncbi:MAG: SDR family oxidoreductase [Boseongicola sp.]|nr:MAG: SDR family oxidoreductase [Boseongicola sp.]